MNPKFLAYVVHLDASDEYLREWHSTISGIGGWLWAKTPELAFKFQDEKSAIKIAEKYGKNAVVGMLWDVGDQLMVYLKE